MPYFFIYKLSVYIYLICILIFLYHDISKKKNLFSVFTTRFLVKRIISKCIFKRKHTILLINFRIILAKIKIFIIKISPRLKCLKNLCNLNFLLHLSTSSELHVSNWTSEKILIVRLIDYLNFHIVDEHFISVFATNPKFGWVIIWIEKKRRVNILSWSLVSKLIKYFAKNFINIVFHFNIFQYVIFPSCSIFVTFSSSIVIVNYVLHSSITPSFKKNKFKCLNRMHFIIIGILNFVISYEAKCYIHISSSYLFKNPYYRVGASIKGLNIIT